MLSAVLWVAAAAASAAVSAPGDLAYQKQVTAFSADVSPQMQETIHTSYAHLNAGKASADDRHQLRVAELAFERAQLDQCLHEVPPEVIGDRLERNQDDGPLLALTRNQVPAATLKNYRLTGPGRVINALKALEAHFTSPAGKAVPVVDKFETYLRINSLLAGGTNARCRLSKNTLNLLGK